MSLSKTWKRTKLPRTLKRCPQKEERKEAVCYTIDGIRSKKKMLRTQSFEFYLSRGNILIVYIYMWTQKFKVRTKQSDGLQLLPAIKSYSIH